MEEDEVLGVETSFEVFHHEAEPRLRSALVASFGPIVGREAALDALSYAWENWERVRIMDNPVGYLYRLAARKARRTARGRSVLFATAEARSGSHSDSTFEPGLPSALEQLSVGQRQAVVLVYAWGYSYRETAELLGVSPSTVQKHLERGLSKLRKQLGVSADE